MKSSPIEINVESSSPEKIRTGLLVVGAFADGTLPPFSKKIDEASNGKLSHVIKRGDLEEKAGSSLLLHDLPYS
jgi:leucyl aminopeptidase